MKISDFLPNDFILSLERLLFTARLERGQLGSGAPDNSRWVTVGKIVPCRNKVTGEVREVFVGEGETLSEDFEPVTMEEFFREHLVMSQTASNNL